MPCPLLGIYRQAGQETKIKQLLNECLEDPFNNLLTRENYTEHDVANGLKRFLRQLETPLLGSRQNYDAWLRSTVDPTITSEQLIQYYRGLLVDLKQNYSIQYATLKKILMHIQTVSMLSDRNGMILSNLVSTFAPCIISQIIVAPVHAYVNDGRDGRGMSFDDMDMKYSKVQDDNGSLFDEEPQDSLGLLINTSAPAKLKRNPSLQCTSSSFACQRHFASMRSVKRESLFSSADSRMFLVSTCSCSSSLTRYGTCRRTCFLT